MQRNGKYENNNNSTQQSTCLQSLRLICIQTNGKTAIYLFELLGFCIGIGRLVQWQSYFSCLCIRRNGMVCTNLSPYQSTNVQSCHCMDPLQRAVRTKLNQKMGTEKVSHSSLITFRFLCIVFRLAHLSTYVMIRQPHIGFDILPMFRNDLYCPSSHHK